MARRQSSFIPSQAACTYHFALHVVVELDPSFFHLWSKCSAKLLFQAPYQRVAKRSEMQWLRPELCVLATRMANDRVEHFSLVERRRKAVPQTDGHNRCHCRQERVQRIGGKIGQRAFDGPTRSRRTIV